MTTITEATRKYRLPNPTTPEDLESRWSKVLRFDDRILVAGHYNGHGKSGYFGAVYEFLDDEDHTCESTIGLKAVSDPGFYDDGHAIFWAMMREIEDSIKR